MPSPYSFKKNAEGNIEVLQNGQRISTGTASAASRYGYDETSIALPKIEPTSTPTLFSTDRGQAIVDEKKQRADTLAGIPTPTPTPETTAPAPTGKVSLINANGQTVDFENPDINKDNIQNYLNSGYSLKSASGAIPTWLSPTTTGGATVKPPTQAETELNNAKAEKDSAVAQLKNLDVSKDPALQSMLSSISSGWDARIKDMERANASRVASITQTGVRLGSRYTGGAGGVFGGIISTEEKDATSRIATLEGQKQSALMEAKNAYENKKWNQYAKLVDIADSAYKEQLSALKDLNTAQAAQDKVLQEKNAKLNEGLAASKRDVAISELMGMGVTNPMDIINKLSEQGITASAKDIWESIKVFAKDTGISSIEKLTGDTKNFFVLKGIQGALPSSITGLPQEQQLGAYMKWNKDLTTSKVAKVAGETGASSFDQFSKEQIALSVIPTQLRNSDTELKRYLEGIRQGLGEGKTPYEVADQLMGYKINNPTPFSNSIRNYIALADLGASEIQSVARLVNAKDYGAAITIIENKLLDGQKKIDPESYVGETTPKYYVSKVDEIKKLIEQGGLMDAIGPLEGSAASVFGKVPLFRRKEAAKIQGKVTSLVAELRNHLSGTAVTDSEKAFLEPLIASLSDKKGIFMDKLNEISTNSLTRHNAVRKSAGLPELDEKTLLNKKLRTSLYENVTSTNNSIDTEDVIIGKISKFYSASPENAKKIDELKLIAPDATPEEIAQQLQL